MASQPLLLFVTGNENKFTEAQRILKRIGIDIEQFPNRPPEIQADSLDTIARHCCEKIVKEVNRPVFVEDAGMFIFQLKGFPGPYSSYVLRTISNPGILKLMEGVKDRTAVFRSTIAYASPNQECVIFRGETFGEISRRIRGTHWGFDPIFIPQEGDGSTYAEMPVDMKNRISHRAKSLAKFASWLMHEKK